MEEFMKEIIWTRRKFKKIVSKARKALDNRNFLSTVAWAQIGADLLSRRHAGIYFSSVLESLLLEVSQHLAKQKVNLPIKIKHDGKKHILHVMTEAYKTGGHTRAVKGLITNTSNIAVHSLITTSQGSPFPKSLAETITSTGGWYLSFANLPLNLLQRSILLREISREWADVIILYVHPFDVLPTVALGVEDAPPTILFNHADHIFWLGVSIADIVADFRTLGQRLTLARRGARKSQILPLPLLKINSFDRETARKQLGVKDDTIVLLTIGSEYKFTPFLGYDFIKTSKEIVKRNPKTVLIAVGPRNSGQWAEAFRLTNGKIRPFGVQTNLEVFYACADIYLPSFPLGGGTATLDAGARGLPIVALYVQESPMLCGVGDIALDKMDIYASSVEEYLIKVAEMIASSNLRRNEGQRLKKQIKSINFPPAWNNYFKNLISSLPTKHTVKLPSPTNIPIGESDLFLAGFCSKRFPRELSFTRAFLKHSRNFPKREFAKTIFEELRTKPNLYTILLTSEQLLPYKFTLAIDSSKFIRKVRAKIGKILRGGV